MNNLNSILLEGNLTKDPLTKTFDNSMLCTFVIASNRSYKKDDEYHKEVSYFSIESWGKTAENCGKYLTKGSGVRVVGRLKQDRWEDDGEKMHQKTKIVAEHVDFFPRQKKSTIENNAKGNGEQNAEEMTEVFDEASNRDEDLEEDQEVSLSGDTDTDTDT